MVRKVSNEIDRLEIAVEAEANRANRALSGMEKRLNKIADSLEKVVSLSSSIDSFGNFDFSQFDKAKEAIDEVLDSGKRLGKGKVSPKVSDSEIKRASKSLDDLYDKFKDVGSGIDVSDMNLSELQASLKNAESTASRLNDRLDKKIELDGTDNLGKSWESLVYDIQKATNQAENYREAISKIKATTSDFPIHRGNDEKQYESDKIGKTDIPMHDYNADAMKSVFGDQAKEWKTFSDVVNALGGNASLASKKLNALDKSMNSQKVNTFSAQINRLKKELSDLASSGYTEFDPEYDNVAKELAEVTQAKKEYDKAMRNSVSDKGLKSTKKSLRDIIRELKSAGNIFSNFGKKAVKSIGNVIKGAGKLKKAITGTQKQANKGMSFGRMLGSSVAFSFIFQGISMIQQAIKEGSDNLTQYSSEYNHSISSMVSSLLYLKNAWAAAFAPIVNVVAPYIEAFVSMIASALNAVGRFMAALTGNGFAVQAKKVWKDYGAGLKDTTNGLNDAAKAAKDLQSYTLGIDELNVIQPQDASGVSSGGGAGGGGTDMNPSDMFETVKVEGVIANFAKSLREAFLAEDWEGLGKILADGVNTGLQYLYDAISWENVGPKITYFANAFTVTFNSLVDNINWDLMGRTVGTGINAIANTLSLFLNGIDWKNLGTSFASGLMGIISEVNWENLGDALGKWFMISWEIFYGFVTNLDYSQIGLALASGINGMFDSIDIGLIFGGIAKFISGIGQGLLDFSKNIDWESIGLSIADGVNNFFSNFDAVTIMKGINAFLHGILDLIITAASEIDWAQVGKKIADFLFTFDVVGIIKKLSKAIWEIFSGIDESVSVISKELGDKLEEAFSEAWEKIKEIFSPVSDFFSEKFSAARKSIEKTFENIDSWFGEKYDSIKKVYSDVKGYFSKKFDEAYQGIKNAFSGIGDFFDDIWRTIKSKFTDIGEMVGEAIGGAFKSTINGVLKLVENTINKGLGFINGAIGAINKLPGVSIPKFDAISLPRLADGGMLSSGQMFIAREKGPELVGNYGSKTAVMNNNQIVQSVSNGVRLAIENSNDRVEYLLTQILEAQQRILAKDNSPRIDGKKAGQLIDRARNNSGYNFRTV